MFIEHGVKSPSLRKGARVVVRFVRAGQGRVVLCGGFVGGILFEAVFGFRLVIFEAGGFEAGVSQMHAYSHRGRSD